MLCYSHLAWLWRSDLVRIRMRTFSKKSLNVCSLKVYQLCVKASSVDSSHLFIISAIRSARNFANGCEKHLLCTLDFLRPSEKQEINDNWEPPLVLFLFFQFLFLFPPYFSDRVVVSTHFILILLWFTTSVDRWWSGNVDRCRFVGVARYCFCLTIVELTSKSQPSSLRSLYTYMIIKYSTVGT